MSRLRVMSLNAENLGDIVSTDLEIPHPDGNSARLYWRARLLAAIVNRADPDILGLVEAPSTEERTREFVEKFLDDGFTVHQGERRGSLGLAFLVRHGLDIQVKAESKEQSLKDFKLGRYDADGDGIQEVYSWAHRVPFKVTLSGEGLLGPVAFILIHAKSKAAFIPGDLHAYQRLS